MSTSTAIFPPEFADLEPFAAWSMHADHDRYQRRLASTMDELQVLYDAVVPRAEAAMAYLDQYEFDALPEPAIRLMWLLYSLTTISFAVDIFKQPRVPDSGAAYIKIVREPNP